MNRNILKLTSMLFLGLALATSCSKDKPEASKDKPEASKDKPEASKDEPEAGSKAELEEAEGAADGTANTIEQFNTATP